MSLFAQELEDIQDRIQKGKWKEAQEKVDKYLANEKNAKKPEGWYYKAVVYDNISKDSTLKSLSPDPKGEAFAAYKKYVELDPKLVLGTLYQHITLFDLFYSYNDLAITAFNAKNFDTQHWRILKSRNGGRLHCAKRIRIQFHYTAEIRYLINSEYSGSGNTGKKDWMKPLYIMESLLMHGWQIKITWRYMNSWSIITIRKKMSPTEINTWPLAGNCILRMPIGVKLN